MILELATLPTVFQQYIQENPSLEIKLVDGKVIATPKLVERPFNFDIEEMASNADYTLSEKGDYVSEYILHYQLFDDEIKLVSMSYHPPFELPTPHELK